MTSTDDLNETSVGCFAQGTEGDLGQCVVDGVFGAEPAPSLMGLLMGGTVLTSLYIAGDGSVVVPSVVTILIGAAMIPTLPAQYVGMAYTVTAIGVAVAVFSMWTRFTHQGGF